MDGLMQLQEPVLMRAEDLSHKQADYLNKVNDTEMRHIISVLNEAYKQPDRYKTFDRISEHNIGKLRLAGYKVEDLSSQREGSWYRVTW